MGGRNYSLVPVSHPAVVGKSEITWAEKSYIHQCLFVFPHMTERPSLTCML